MTRTAGFTEWPTGGSVPEPGRDTPVAGRFDVVVCGGGPAGLAAAISAARRGAATALIERNGCLGGVWTAGMLSAVLDADKPGGVLSDIVARLHARGAHVPRSRSNFVYDVEQMKLVVEELCIEADVRVRLHTYVTAAHVDQHGRLRAVLTESKSGRQAWAGSVFVDCTGDGDLAAQAGCRYSMGHPESGLTQPLSLMAIVAGADAAATRGFWHGEVPGRKQALLAEFRAAGFEPSYTAPTLFHVRDDVYALMANHQYQVRADDAAGITDATLRARAEIDRSVRALRSLGGAWSGLSLVATAEQIGVREGRRIVGRDTVVEADLVTGRSRVDAVTTATFGMDVHSPDPGHGRDFAVRDTRPVLPYGIPYGALVAADVDGLLMAGRCISGDFMAHSSYRVTGNATAMGQAAGVAAAACAAGGLQPHELDWTPAHLATPEPDSATEAPWHH